MGILTRFRSRDKPKRWTDSVSSAIQYFFGYGNAGENVTPETAMRLSTVYACVRVIAESVATMSLHVYKQKPSGGLVKAEETKLDRLLHREPNPEMTSFVWRETMMSHLLLWGNAYSQIIRNGRGEVIELYPLLAENMEVERDSETRRLQYFYTDSRGERHLLAPEDVLHLHGLGFDGVMGYSPIAMEKNAISLSLAAEKYGSNFFGSGAIPAGIITHPGQLKNPGKLRASWMKNYGGAANAGSVAILEEGMKFEHIAIPNNEAQFLETRKFQVSEICRIYRVPPHMIGDLEHATFSNIEHQGMEFVKYTISPWVSRIEQDMERALLAPEEKGRFQIKFNVDSLQRGDFKSRMEAYHIGRQDGIYSANDIREKEDMELLSEEDGGNAYLVNGNMIPIKLAMQGTNFKKDNGQESDREE